LHDIAHFTTTLNVMSQKEYFNQRQLCKHLGISVATIQKMREDGLPVLYTSKGLLLFKLIEVEKFLRGEQVDAEDRADAFLGSGFWIAGTGHFNVPTEDYVVIFEILEGDSPGQIKKDLRSFYEQLRDSTMR